VKEQLRARLQELKAEFERGQQQLAELEAQANSVRTMLLRISGAMQVLQELLATTEAKSGNGAGAMEIGQVAAATG
jgi:predicted nuclease with TOPRIM domain